MQEILNTLYVTQPQAYLHLENQTVRVDIQKITALRVPMHHLGSIVCFGAALVSAPLLQKCSEDGISVVFLDRYGRFKARLEGPVSGNILLRQAQFASAADNTKTIHLAKSFVAGKIRNSRSLLLRSARDTADTQCQEQCRQSADRLADILKRLSAADSLDQLRGLEGEAAREYFGAQPTCLAPSAQSVFTMRGRNRRPPLDPYNALLSFLYALVMNDCRSALETVGLDPQQGFLHAVRPGRAALALDLMEEFRPVLADRLALTLVNRQQIKENDFEASETGSILLSDSARKTLLTAYQTRKQETIRHPVTQQNTAIGLLPMIQARLLARVIRGDVSHYIPYLHK